MNRLNHLLNIHIGLWLVKDFAWCSDYAIFGACIAAATLMVAAWIAWESRESSVDLLHNIAVCFWATANTTWMMGEFFYHDQLRPNARVLFLIGFVIIAAWYVRELFERLWPAKPQTGECEP